MIQMLRSLLAASLGLVIIAGTSSPAGAAEPVPSVAEVTKHLNDLYRSKSSHGTIRMKVSTKHYTRELSMEAWSRGEDLSLMVIRAPAREAGTATLKTNEGLWNYAPRADRMMRIPSSLLSESWMGSHFTNDDLMRESSYVEDYDTTLSWVERDGQRYLLTTMIPKKSAAVVYTKVTQLLSAEGWLPVRADYYDGAEVVRTMTFSEVKLLGGRKLPTVMEIRPADKPKEYTRVTYDDMSFDVAVDKDLFSPRGLRRKAQQR